MSEAYSRSMPEIQAYSEMLLQHARIPDQLFKKYNVFRGLRDDNGKGVLTGLTEISEIQSRVIRDGVETFVPGRLFYRGIDIQEIIAGVPKGKPFGFEEVTYLLLFGNLPNIEELRNFYHVLSQYRTLPTSFVRDIIMKAPSRSMMNTMTRSVLTLYSYDDFASDTSIPNVLRQCIELIAIFPMLGVYGYQVYRHYIFGESLIIHLPDPNLSTAENILRMLRPDRKYTELEARILDVALMLHAEHGGGNNSTFTCRVVTSSGTDTYSAIAAALGSLKGPKHGGANIKVVEMFADMKENLSDWEDQEAICEYLRRLLHGEAFDHKGLIYGMGHAIYAVSDPRAETFKLFVRQLAEEKGRMAEYNLYRNVAELAPKIIGEERHIFKGVSPNVDFYSGFVYNMLDLPLELYTPIFAFARISGWSAHRLEELMNAGKIIRPAYMEVTPRREYVPIAERKSFNAQCSMRNGQ